jgi:hypothetical protein
MVSQESAKPTPEEIEKLAFLSDTRVSTTELTEWYVLLRNTQGHPEMILACGYAEDNHEFPLDSLFCEWGYVVDFDHCTFEVYKGFQNIKHDKGRFAERSEPQVSVSGAEYFPIALVAEYSLERLPTNEELCALERNDDEAE